MTKLAKQLCILSLGFFFVSPGIADEAAPANAQVLAMCECLQKGKDRNCGELSVTKTETPARADGQH